MLNKKHFIKSVQKSVAFSDKIFPTKDVSFNFVDGDVFISQSLNTPFWCIPHGINQAPRTTGQRTGKNPEHCATCAGISAGEAKDFWPIYNKYNEILHNLNVQIRNCRKSGCDKKENLTEKEALEILDKDSELMGKILQANREKDKELLKVISAKKLLLLKNAEKEFHRKLIKQYRNSK